MEVWLSDNLQMNNYYNCLWRDKFILSLSTQSEPFDWYNATHITKVSGNQNQMTKWPNDKRFGTLFRAYILGLVTITLYNIAVFQKDNIRNLYGMINCISNADHFSLPNIL